MFRFLLALGLLLGSTGCATLMSGMIQKVEVVSDPPGAQAVLDTGQTVTTPGILRVEKRHAHQVTVSMEGFRPATVPVTRRVQWTVMGNVFFLIVPGILVDFLGGGAFGLPKQLKVRLTPLPTPTPEPAPPPPPENSPEPSVESEVAS